MRTLGRASALAAAGLLVGCTHQTVTISESTPTAKVLGSGTPRDWNAKSVSVAGIPFYVKQGVCQRETIWAEPQYTLTLAVAIDGQPPMTHTLTLSRAGYQSQSAQDLLALISGITGTYKMSEIYAQGCPATIGRQWNALTTDPKFQARPYAIVKQLDVGEQLGHAEADGNAFRIADTATLGTAVDYTHQYYFNANAPWAGSSQVTAKIGQDGTLTEGTAQRDDQTASTILSAITSLVGDFTGTAAAAAASPAASAAAPTAAAEAAAKRKANLARELAAADKARPACPSIPGWPSPMTKLMYKYSLTTMIYTHDHQDQSFDLSTPCVPDGRGVLGGSYKVSMKAISATAADKKDDKTIKFDGSIELPKDGKKGGKDSKPDGKTDGSADD